MDSDVTTYENDYNIAERIKNTIQMNRLSYVGYKSYTNSYYNEK